MAAAGIRRGSSGGESACRSRYRPQCDTAIREGNRGLAGRSRLRWPGTFGSGRVQGPLAPTGGVRVHFLPCCASRTALTWIHSVLQGCGRLGINTRESKRERSPEAGGSRPLFASQRGVAACCEAILADGDPERRPLSTSSRSGFAGLPGNRGVVKHGNPAHVPGPARNPVNAGSDPIVAAAGGRFRPVLRSRRPEVVTGECCTSAKAATIRIAGLPCRLRSPSGAARDRGDTRRGRFGCSVPPLVPDPQRCSPAAAAKSGSL